MQIGEILLTLLRIGLETEKPSDSSLKAVAGIKMEEWQVLLNLSETQGVSSIVFDGIHKLCSKYGAEQVSASTIFEKWQEFILDWSSKMLYMEQNNQHQVFVLNDMAEKWKEEGCRVMVMKGQANALLYPHPNHRSPGDIDCYLFENYSKGNDIARKNGIKVNEGWYKHSVFDYKAETFENHQFFVHTREGSRSKLLEKELEEALVVNEWNTFPHSVVLLPPVQWNAMFLTYHACAHFLSEGLRLKQILDWALFLKKYQNDIDWSAFYRFCDRHHLRCFTDAVTAICVEYLGLRITNHDISTFSPYREKILQSVFF